MAVIKEKIIILDDDEAIGTSLKELFSRSGHHAIFIKNQIEFLKYIESNVVDYVFADCFMPGIPGVEVIKQAKLKKILNPFKVILMSGILTDKSFITESIKTTEAIHFLKKPFDLKEALSLIEPTNKKKNSEDVDFVKSIASKFVAEEDMSLDPRKKLYKIFSTPNVTTRYKRKLIESLEDVRGYDLPFIYSLLVETRSSGFLNIYSNGNNISGITFCDGNIVGVDIEDKNTYLGEMLIQSGYASPEDVQYAIREKKKTKFGDFMIQENLLSPHAFDLILSEQMNVRLSKTIEDQGVKVNFSPSETELTNPYIDAETLSYYLHDWIVSKISIGWLKSFYFPMLENHIQKGPAFHSQNSIFQMSVIKSLDQFVEQLSGMPTINQLLMNKKNNEVAIYKALHLLLTKGVILIGESEGEVSFVDHYNNLVKMWEEFSNKDSIDVVQYLEQMGLYNSEEGITDQFLKMMGTEPLEGEAKKLWNQIKDKVIESASEARDSTRFKKLQEESQIKHHEIKLKVSSMAEEIKQCLNMNQAQKAQVLLKKIKEMNSEVENYALLSAWTKLLLYETARSPELLKDVELEMMQISPDQKYDALYPFLNGLYYKMKGDLKNAKKNFEKSIALNPAFIQSRRELSLIEAKTRPVKQESLLTGDLKEIVSGFFKKK